MRRRRGPVLPASAACLAPRQRRQGSRGQSQEEHRGGKVDDRDAGRCAPARGEAADDALDQDRAETCRREETPLARDARCPERGQRRCRREAMTATATTRWAYSTKGSHASGGSQLPLQSGQSLPHPDPAGCKRARLPMAIRARVERTVASANRYNRVMRWPRDSWANGSRPSRPLPVTRSRFRRSSARRRVIRRCDRSSSARCP